MNTSTRYRMVSEGTQGRYRSEAEEYRRRMRGYGNDPDDYRGADPMRREEWDRDGGIEPGRAEPNNYRRFRAEGTGDGTYRMAYESNGTSRRMAGFGNAEMHTGSGKQSKIMRGGASGGHEEQLTREKVEQWVDSMLHADGSGEGERWSFEKAKRMLDQRGLDLDPVEWYAILNAMYADYCSVAMKFGLGGNTEFYAAMAEAWLCDEDAVENKAAMYYECIAK